MKIYYLSFVLSFFCLNILFSQKYALREYNTKNGLSSNAVLDILQAKDGYIWMVTGNGVSRFNGNKFKNFGEKEGLTTKVLYSIFEDSKNRIWFGSLDKGAFLYERGKIKNLTDIHPSNMLTVKDILEGQDGSIYLICTNGVIKYNDGVSQVYPLVKGDNKVGVKPRQAVLVDENLLYMATIDTGIAVLNVDNGDLRFIDSESHDINNITYSIKKDKSNTLWVGTYGELVKVRKDSVLEKFKFNPNEYHINRVTDISIKDDNNLLLTFEGNGFGFFDSTSGEYELINSKNGLPTENCYSILEDNEKNIWVGTGEFGLIRFRDKGFTLHDTSNGLLSNVIYGMASTKNKNFIGTDKGLMSFEDGKIQDTLYSQGPVYVLNSNIENEILFSTANEIITVDKNYNKSVLDETGFFLYAYKDKNISMFFNGNQLKIKGKDSIVSFKNRDEFKPYILDFLPLDEHHIFFTFGGVYEIKSNEISPIQIQKNIRILSLSKIDDSSFMVADNKSIHYIIYRDSKYKVTTIPQSRFGVKSEFIALEIIDEKLWMAFQDVFMSVELKELLEQDTVISESYKIDNSLFEMYGTNNLVTTYDKKLMGRTLESGLFMFDETQFIQHKIPSKTKIDLIELFSEELNDSLYLNKGDIVFPYDKNYLTFHLDAISFTYPESVNYKFRLKGLSNNDQWSKPTKDTKIVYSYIPPGKYSFEFVADNGNNIWNETITSYDFEIRAPFWRLPWFWVITILGISGFSLLYVLRRNKIKEQQAQKFSQDLIQAQEEERTRISKDLHDSVGQQLTLIKKKAQHLNQSELSKMSNDALEEVRSISRDLFPTTLKQLGFKQSVEQLVNHLDEGVDMFFTFEADEIDKDLDEEKSLNLYRFIQESLSNVVKHSNARAVSIIITKNINQIEAVVSDNGKGFNSTVVKNSLGLKTMAERIKMLKGTLAIKSRLNQGTTIIAQIPV